MSKEFFDFDELFEQFVRLKYFSGELSSAESIKENMGELFEEWANTPLDALMGECPSRYFESIDSPEVLVEFLIKSCRKGRTPSVFLLDKIAAVALTAPYLRELISKHDNTTLTLTAIELLDLMGASQPLEEYIEMLKEGIDDVELQEQIIEILVKNVDSVAESLFLACETASLEQKTIFAELLINAKPDKRTSELLKELFIESENIPLIASYIGKYGDENLASDLYKALKDCNYLEYQEIKNAIERLGGIVEDTRDFSSDPFYEIIKNGNN